MTFPVKFILWATFGLSMIRFIGVSDISIPDRCFPLTDCFVCSASTTSSDGTFSDVSAETKQVALVAILHLERTYLYRLQAWIPLDSCYSILSFSPVSILPSFPNSSIGLLFLCAQGSKFSPIKIHLGSSQCVAT